jgi:hypothetical protein
MKIIIALFISLACCGIGADAQSNSVPGKINIDKTVTVLPDTARFQIISMAQLGAIVVRLDRFTGKTSVYDPGRRRWFPLDVRGGLPAVIATTPKYQIYTEGDDFNFLVNSETGQSWILNVRTWEPVTD